MTPNRRELFDRILSYQNDLVSFFAGGEKFDDQYYERMRSDLLGNEAYNGLAPGFVRRCRDTGSLWSYAKNVDGSWEPRRKFVRESFEALLDHIEAGPLVSQRFAGPYDSSAWTGVTTGVEQVKAMRTMLPLAQSAIEVLIAHLEEPNHNGALPLEETTEAVACLKALHLSLGNVIDLLDKPNCLDGDGLIVEAAKYGKRAAKALKEDPVPYALSASILAILGACGFPGIGGYLSGIAVNMRKSGSQ